MVETLPMHRLLSRPDLPPNARRTFRFHVAYALLDAACGGILLNAPVVALKAIEGQNWQLPIREAFSGIGMLVGLYLGSWMAARRKMPFVFLPGILAGCSSVAMALAMNDALLFFTLFGVGALLEIITRPAIAAILRQNYPVAVRGFATGTVRLWSSLSFGAVNLLSAYLLNRAGNDLTLMKSIAAAQIMCASLLGLSAFVCFRQIRVREEPESLRDDFRPEVVRNVCDAASVVIRDGRFRRYLFGCFLDGFSAMLYFPLIWALLNSTLKFSVLGCVVLMHTIPAVVAFGTTALLGRWFDRGNPWISWAWVRFGWGVDAILLAATPWAASFLPPLVLILPLFGRVIRGSVQGGSWILWWQIGVTYFAPPGEDTSRYMGIMVFLNGLMRFAASAVAMALAAFCISPQTIIFIGGLGVIASGLYSLWQAAGERKAGRPQTFAAFEAQFNDSSPHAP
jgi:MFS family permease